MRIEITEALWIDEHHQYSLTELVELSGLSAAEFMILLFLVDALSGYM